MSFVPCITLANLTTPVTQLGGVGNDPTFSTITTETLYVPGLSGSTSATFEKTQVNDILVAMIGTETGDYPIDQSGNVNTEYIVKKQLGLFSLGAVGFDTLRTTRVNNQYDYRIFNGQGGNTASVIFDGFGELDASASDVYSSTVTTQAVYIEGQVLTADNDQLFLNGIPVATSANVSSIADWSYYAQVSTLDGNNQNIQSVNNLQAFSGNFQSLTTTVLTVNTVVSQSTITNYSTITTVDIIADEGNISTLQGTDLSFVTVAGQASFASTITLGDTTTGLLSVDGAGALLYNGSTITAGGGGSASNWSTTPAIQTVNFNTFGINNGGAFNAASLATSGNIFSLGSMSAAANITGNNVTGTNGVFGSGVNVSGNVNSAGVTTGTITASGLVNCQSGLNGVGEISLIGNIGDTVKLATDANATGIRLQAGAMLLTTAAAFSLNAGGAGNLAAGGAISIAAGDYIQLNAGYIDVIGGSIIKVNGIQKQSGSLSIDSTTIVNSGGIYTNVLSAPSIVPSLSGQTSSIVGIDLIANSNSFVAKNMSTVNLNVSTINGALPTTAFQYILTGTTVNGVITNPIGFGAGNVWPQNTWSVISQIVFNVPPNWSSTSHVVWDGWTFYDFFTANNNYWSVYYLTNTQPVEQPLVGDKTTGVLNAIGNLNNGQFYFPLNVLIPPTYITTGGTITLRVYGYTTTSVGYLASLPIVNGRVSVALV